MIFILCFVVVKLWWARGMTRDAHVRYGKYVSSRRSNCGRVGNCKNCDGLDLLHLYMAEYFKKLSIEWFVKSILFLQLFTNKAKYVSSYIWALVD